MKIAIENRGAATVELSALCGDFRYSASLRPASSSEWQPPANACTVEVTGASEGRRVTIRNECRHAFGCSLEVALPPQGRARLTGSGRVEVTSDGVTVAAHSPR